MKAWSFFIEGKKFSTIRQISCFARGRGFTGCDETIRYRIKNGATTWAELLAPLNEGPSKGGRVSDEKRASRRAKEKELMAQLCAELDARKDAIKENP